MHAVLSVGIAGLERYAERADVRENWLTKFERIAAAAPQRLLQGARRRRCILMQVQVNALEEVYSKLTDDQLREKGTVLRSVLRCQGYETPQVLDVFALVREVSRRVVGLRHHDVQIRAGFAMLGGAVAEMDTGEGKTVTATLTAVAAAFAGIPVHVITVNQYLAERDWEKLRPIYEFFGLSVGVISHELGPEERANVYGRDIVYASNKEIAFDYLRDRIVLGSQPNMLRLKLRRLTGRQPGSNGLVMRGLHFAIVDEADSVLVDEARTPLIISRGSNAAEEEVWARQTFRIIGDFERDKHYVLIPEDRRVKLTDLGITTLEERAQFLDPAWHNHVRREEAARQALAALHLFRNGEHYLVHEGKVQIVDEYTGRMMPDRSWSDGMHQLIELKEGCEVTARKFTVARMTYQRFFRRYIKLAGMTGTAREVRSELWSVYGISVQRIPPHRPSRRSRMRSRVCGNLEEKWKLIVARTRAERAKGRPVLIGTRSINASQTVSSFLSSEGIDHVVLNAENSAEEAGIIARAGCGTQVTVATNMAGRGVDIEVADEVCEKGGLHVVLSERHDAQRIDRQMEGRAGRRGQPGSTETILSLEDPLLELLPGKALLHVSRYTGRFGRWWSLGLFALAQHRAQRSYARDRRMLLAQDKRLGVLLAFSGRME